MPPSTQVAEWLVKNFPKPHVDPEWLRDCTRWLEEDEKISSSTNFEEFIEGVKTQLLASDLSDSMQAGTGFEQNVLTMSGHLRGPPFLVQIIAITDISSSAYQLDQIRSAREERMLAGEGNEEGEGDGDVEVEGEGPMPKYPRGTLRFQLSDGQKTIQAMEYRRIPAFNLGNTPLGFKIQLKGTKFQNGMAMLEPDTVILLGGKQSELEAKQLEDFKWGLHLRLGRPLPQPEEIINDVSTRTEEPLPTTTIPRSPLTDIRLPATLVTQTNDDIDLEPRRRLPAHPTPNQIQGPSDKEDIKQMRPIIALPSRNSTTNVVSANHSEGSNGHPQGKRPISMAERATLIHVGPRGMMEKSSKSPYFNEASGSVPNRSQKYEINTAVEALDFNLEPTHAQTSHFLPSPSPLTYESPSNPDYFNFDLLDEVDQENPDHRPAYPLQKGKERQQGFEGTSSHETLPSGNDDHSSDDYGMDDDNDFNNPLFLEEIDVLEKAALQYPRKTSTSDPPLSGIGTKSSSGKPLTERPSVPPSQAKMSRKNPHSQRYALPAHVIEIEDSDDEMEELDDKENEPVPTRHVRRRLEHSKAPEASGVSLQTQLSQKGRPIILATNPDDIIDLSDSD